MSLYLMFLFTYIVLLHATPRHWDYLMLSLRWPGTLCQFTECSTVPQPTDFVIHGLWPTVSPDANPEKCDPAPDFDVERLKPLLPELNKHWPNLFPGSEGRQFWKHEWHAHGRCSLEDGLIHTETDYFNVSLQLRTRSDLLNKLLAAGVSPNEETSLQLSNLSQILSDTYGATVQLHCLKRHHQVPYLFEIRLCLSPDLNYINCSKARDCIDPTNFCNTFSEAPSEGSCPAMTESRYLSPPKYSDMPCPDGPVIFPPLPTVDLSSHATLA